MQQSFENEFLEEAINQIKSSTIFYVETRLFKIAHKFILSHQYIFQQDYRHNQTGERNEMPNKNISFFALQTTPHQAAQTSPHRNANGQTPFHFPYDN